ncbi:MAG: hypothetical protein WA364_20715 [Candidatus Nitrosopolaris sp.]
MDKTLTLILVGLLAMVLVLWTITDGIEIGQRGGKIYPDNTPPLGSHHWTLSIYAMNESPYESVSIFCQLTTSPTQMFTWNWCFF